MAEERQARLWLWGVVGGGAFFLFALAVLALIYLSVGGGHEPRYYGSGGSGGNIGVVELEGVILSPKDTVRELKHFADDDSIKAIILHINSPGGGAAASEEIYREVKRIHDQKKKPIVASIETVGASGAYYAASAADQIFADGASVVGSIGVIAEWYNYGDLLRWARLHEVVIKAGEFKDTGDPARPMTAVERAYLQGLIDNMHQQFIRNVALGRGARADDIAAIANGKVWTGEQALGLKLVDQIGGFRVAVEETAKAVGIQGEPNLVRAEKEKASVWDFIFGDAGDLLPSRARLMERQPGFYYLWK